MDTTPLDLEPVAGQDPTLTLLAKPLRATTLGAVAMVAVFAFEAIAVATVMPVVAADLDGLSLYGLAFGSTMAASVVGMVAAGIGSDRGRTRAVFVLGATLFGFGLLTAGFAPTMGILVAGRALQGLGSGAAVVALYVLVDTLPEHLKAKMFAAFASAWVLPALLGPAIAGVLADHVHWRAVFLATVAIVVPAGLTLRHRFALIPSDGPAPWSRHDRRRLGAAVVAAGGAAALHLAGQSEGFRTALLLAVGLLLLASSIRSLVPSGTLRLAPGLPAVIGLRAVAGSAFIAAEVLIPLLLTARRGMSTTGAGTVLTVGALGWSFGSWLQGRFAQPPTRWMAGGLTLIAGGVSVLSTTIALPVPVWVAPAGWVFAGLGMGMLFPTLSLAVLRLSPPKEQGTNVSALQVADALASATTLAVVGTLLALRGTGAEVFVTGFAMAVVLILVGLRTVRTAIPEVAPLATSASR